ERAYGDARGINDYVVLDCVEGLGAGAIIKGQLLEGHLGFAGELGHVAVDPEHGPLCGCGNRGCLETLATDAALARQLSERIGRKLSIDDALELVRQGEAKPEVQQTLDAMSIGLAAVINIFNPAAVFVHARILDTAPDMLGRLVTLTRRRA